MKLTRLIFILLLFAGAAYATTLPTPTFSTSGPCVNSCFVTIQVPNTNGWTICYSTNGVTPTATVAGTCDAGFYKGPGAFVDIETNNQQLCAIATEAAFTNSAMLCNTYTITTQAVKHPVSAPAATKLTSSVSGTIGYYEPFAIVAPNGNIFVFYSEDPNGVSPDNETTADCWIMYSEYLLGTGWITPPNVNCSVGGDPASGCFYHNSGNCLVAAGGGVDHSGAMMVLMSTWGGTNYATVEGIQWMRSINNGTSWSAAAYITTPTYTQNQMINATANLIAITAGSPGVTGPCAAGCDFISVLGENGGLTGLIFTYNNGASWTDPTPFPAIVQSWPYTTEERALIWLGGMNLVTINRPGNDQAVTQGWPTTPIAYRSTSLGTSWTTYTYNGSISGNVQVTGDPSNWPVSACGVTPGSNWQDTLTRPSVVATPGSSSLYTVLFGERYSCNGVGKNQWQIDTFDSSTVMADGATTMPLPQVLALGTPAVTQLHTVYSYIVPFGSTQLLMVYEQGTTTTTEDIFATILSYPTGEMVSSSKFLNGVTLQ